MELHSAGTNILNFLNYIEETFKLQTLRIPSSQLEVVICAPCILYNIQVLDCIKEIRCSQD